MPLDGSRTTPGPVLAIAQVFALADAFTDRRYRLLILLAVFCSLRWGELAALARSCVDTDEGIIAVRASVVELARLQQCLTKFRSVTGLETDTPGGDD